jgi:hypothetical protein
MKHLPSIDDNVFCSAFERGDVPPAKFNHNAHLKLAYTYLCRGTVEDASISMRRTLKSFLSRNKIPEAKYHETLTRAWLLAVKQFMERSASSLGAEEFILQNPQLLDTGIMLSHYTSETLFSDQARARFIEPNCDPISLGAG